MAYGYAQPPSAHGHPPVPAEGQGRVGIVVHVLGAVLSVALIGGVGWWSYRLMIRDVSGIPVVRALEGPMRVSPADPGGRQAAFQGLAVNSVAADGTPGSGSRHIALAPPPTDLAPEDRGRPPAPQAAEAAAASSPAPTDTVLAAAAVPLGTPGVSRSPVPPARSARVVQAAARAGSAAPAGAAPAGTALAAAGDRAAEAALADIATRLSAPRAIEIDPTTLVAGTRLVQLGAFETEHEARRVWDELTARFPAYLDGRGRVVEAATAGGRVFYRLRAHGFRDEPEARRFCSVFLAEDIDCVPVLIR